MPSSKTGIIGIDVSKAQLDVAVVPAGETTQFANTDVGLGELVAWAQTCQPQLIVLEATGGLELLATGRLTASGLAVAVVNPRQVRDFAKATGRLAKTDRIDAQLIAQFGEAIKPVPRTLKDEATQQLSALLVRRRQLVDMLTAEKNRLSRAPPGTYPERCATAYRLVGKANSQNRKGVGGRHQGQPDLAGQGGDPDECWGRGGPSWLRPCFADCPNSGA